MALAQEASVRIGVAKLELKQAEENLRETYGWVHGKIKGGMNPEPITVLGQSPLRRAHKRLCLAHRQVADFHEWVSSSDYHIGNMPQPQVGTDEVCEKEDEDTTEPEEDDEEPEPEDQDEDPKEERDNILRTLAKKHPAKPGAYGNSHYDWESINAEFFEICDQKILIHGPDSLWAEFKKVYSVEIGKWKHALRKRLYMVIRQTPKTSSKKRTRS